MATIDLQEYVNGLGKIVDENKNILEIQKKINKASDGVDEKRVIEEYKEKEKTLTDKLEKLSYESIDAYITERQNVIVYLTDFSEKSNNFENEFESVALKNDIDEDIVSMNTTELAPDNLTKLKNKYFNDKLKSSKVELNVIPNLLVFQDGKIIDILYKVDTIYDKTSITKFLENHGVIDND